MKDVSSILLLLCSKELLLFSPFVRTLRRLFSRCEYADVCGESLLFSPFNVCAREDEEEKGEESEDIERTNVYRAR